MARFEVKTPVPGLNDMSAGIAFVDGKAVVTSDTASGLGALSYFKSAGYGIAALDGVEIDEALARGAESPEAEHARLTAANQALKARLELDKLRAEHKQLEDQVFKKDESERAEQEKSEQREQDEQKPLLAPPADNASEGQWRAWAHESGRMSADDARKAKKSDIQAEHGAAYDRERAAQLQGESA